MLIKSIFFFLSDTLCIDLFYFKYSAVMPAWIYTVGQVYMKRANLAIPFIGLLGNLFITIGPCLLGLLLGYFLPKLKEFFQRIAKPFTLITLLSFLALVLYTKWYAFGLFEWQYWLAGPLIPWTGYTFSKCIHTCIFYLL